MRKTIIDFKEYIIGNEFTIETIYQYFLYKPFVVNHKLT
jgi:hypothetical protein